MCLARKNPHYLILALGVSIPQRHKHTHAHTEGSALMREMGIHLGHGISWGRNTKPCLNQQQWPSGNMCWVCVRERWGKGGLDREAKQPPPDPKMFPCFFSKHSLWGLYFGYIHHSAYYPFIFFPPPLLPSPFQPFLPEATVGGPEYICLATAAPTCHEPGTNALPWEWKDRERERGGKGSLQCYGAGGLRALVVEWIWQMLRDDTGLDNPCRHLSLLYIWAYLSALPLIYVSWNGAAQQSCGPESRSLPSARQWWRISSSRQCKQCLGTVKLKRTRDEESMVYSNKTHLRKSYYTEEYDNSYTLCWSSELMRVVYSQMSA